MLNTNANQSRVASVWPKSHLCDCDPWSLTVTGREWFLKPAKFEWLEVVTFEYNKWTWDYTLQSFDKLFLNFNIFQLEIWIQLNISNLHKRFLAWNWSSSTRRRRRLSWSTVCRRRTTRSIRSRSRDTSPSALPTQSCSPSSSSTAKQPPKVVVNMGEF